MSIPQLMLILQLSNLLVFVLFVKLEKLNSFYPASFISLPSTEVKTSRYSACIFLQKASISLFQDLQ